MSVIKIMDFSHGVMLGFPLGMFFGIELLRWAQRAIKKPRVGGEGAER